MINSPTWLKGREPRGLSYPKAVTCGNSAGVAVRRDLNPRSLCPELVAWRSQRVTAVVRLPMQLAHRHLWSMRLLHLGAAQCGAASEIRSSDVRAGRIVSIGSPRGGGCVLRFVHHGDGGDRKSYVEGVELIEEREWDASAHSTESPARRGECTWGAPCPNQATRSVLVRDAGGESWWAVCDRHFADSPVFR